jgi:hypothetical protein
LDGYVVETADDPDDQERVRLVVVPALANSPEDSREIVVVCSRDRMMGLVKPRNIDVPPQPVRR